MMLAICSGCASSKRAKSVEYSGFLGDEVYARLQKGKDDQALLVYRNEEVDPTKYSKIMIDSVSFYTPGNASPEELADLKHLSNNFYQYLKEELEKDTPIVTISEPGTVRYQVAITSAEGSNHLLEMMSFIPPYGLGLSLGKNFITGKPTGVGDISMEIKATDAQTGELLGAAVDRRVGEKNLSGIGDTWDDADDAMRFWAKRLRYVNCMNAGKTNCVKP